MRLDLDNTVTLLENWEHFDPEGTRAQKFLRAFADHPQDDLLRKDAEKNIRKLPKTVQNRLRQLAAAKH